MQSAYAENNKDKTTVTTHIETKPETTTTDGTKDERIRHIVKRLGPDTRRFNKIALCGARIRDVHVEHNGTICQECVDKQRSGA